MERCVEDGAIKLPCFEGKPINLRLKTREGHRQGTPVVHCSPQSVKGIGLKINRDWSMSQSRQPVRQPSIPGTEVQDRQGRSLARSEDFPLDVFVGASPDGPLRRI